MRPPRAAASRTETHGAAGLRGRALHRRPFHRRGWTRAWGRTIAAIALLALPAPGAADAAAEEPPAAEGSAEPTCGDRTVDAIQQRYESVSDLSARFEQTTRAASLRDRPNEPTSSRGRVVLAKPGKMRWAYEAPEESLVVSDGETLWLYDATLGEAQRLPVSEGLLSGAAAEFLFGAGELRRDFAITAVSCDPDAARLELVPREPASYEKLFLHADPESGDVHRTRVVDLVGNVSVIEFHDVEHDRDPAPETFRFEPPEGVKVVEPGG